MLAGATGTISCCWWLLPMMARCPQTREHLAIASLLGIRQGAVALTKCDVVTPERQGSRDC